MSLGRAAGLREGGKEGRSKAPRGVTVEFTYREVLFSHLYLCITASLVLQYGMQVTVLFRFCALQET